MDSGCMYTIIGANLLSPSYGVLGDIGDNFYVVDSGKVEVYKKSPDGPDVKVTTPSTHIHI